eukprot:816197-Amphidinium_carterae.1
MALGKQSYRLTMSQRFYNMHKKQLVSLQVTIPWRRSSSHSHQGQGAVERFHRTLFAQCRALRFDLVERYNLQSPNNVPEALLPYVLQHALTNYQRRWGIQYNSAICSFGEIVLADIKPITVKQIQAIGKTTNSHKLNSGEHIVATEENNDKIVYTQSLTRMTPKQHWNREVFESIDVPQMDTTMNADYTEEDNIGKAIIEQFFTKTRLTQKQPGTFRLWVNNKDVQQPPDLENAGPLQDEHITTEQDAIQLQPGLDPVVLNYVHPTPKPMAKPDNYKPSHRLRQTTTTNRCTIGRRLGQARDYVGPMENNEDKKRKTE